MTKYSRPNDSESQKYNKGLNSSRYKRNAACRESLSPVDLDLDFNYLIAGLNEIDKGKNPLNPPENSEETLPYIDENLQLQYGKLTERFFTVGGYNAQTLVQDDSITGDKIQDNIIDNDKLTNNSISTNKIQNNAVTREKIGKAAITSNELANNSVIPAKIPDGSITRDKLAGDLEANSLNENAVNQVANVLPDNTIFINELKKKLPKGSVLLGLEFVTTPIAMYGTVVNRAYFHYNETPSKLKEFVAKMSLKKDAYYNSAITSEQGQVILNQ